MTPYLNDVARQQLGLELALNAHQVLGAFLLLVWW